MSESSNCNLVRRFFEVMARKDLSAWMDFFQVDARMELPFAPEGFQTKRNGKAAIGRGMADAFALWDEISYAPPIIYEMSDPNVVCAETQGNIKLHTGTLYCSAYINLFFFRDHKIALWREYLNPIALLQAHGGSARALNELLPDPNIIRAKPAE